MQSERLTGPDGGEDQVFGLANRGLGGEGFFLEGGKPYDGYLFALAHSGQPPVELTVSLAHRGSDASAEPLATTELLVPTDGEWHRLDFVLTPKAGTQCEGIAPGSDPTVDCGRLPSAASICVRCGGELRLTLRGRRAGLAPTLNLDFVWLQPGPWGRLAGLPVLKSAVDTLRMMGIRVIRMGGSFASIAAGSAAYFQWQKWTGPVWTRNQSTGALWRANLIGGFGPFDFIDMCEAAGIEPVLTTTMSSSPAELAEFVEYCWGPSGTVGGRRRIADGHPAPYRLRFIELGNEQYNPRFVEQVAAMEEKAEELGLGGKLNYLWPGGPGFLNAADFAKAAALRAPAPHQLIVDLHVGGGGAIDIARGVFAAHANFTVGVANLETNAETHHLGRALDEAGDLNAWFSEVQLVGRLPLRTASFCMERSGHFDAFDQGLSMFLPNTTFLQPPGHVHAMVASTYRHHGLKTVVTRGGHAGGAHKQGVAVRPEGFDVRQSRLLVQTDAAASTGEEAWQIATSAQMGDDGSVVVRYVNREATPCNLTIEITGQRAIGADGTPRSGDHANEPRAIPEGFARVTQLSANNLLAENTPGYPGLVSPQSWAVSMAPTGGILTVPAYSYTVIEL